MTATEPVATNESSAAVSSTPVWMTEAKFKRQSRSPAEETSSIMRVNLTTEMCCSYFDKLHTSLFDGDALNGANSDWFSYL